MRDERQTRAHPPATGSIHTLMMLLTHTRRACTAAAGSAATLLKVITDGDPSADPPPACSSIWFATSMDRNKLQCG
jgi:hypothetical protein